MYMNQERFEAIRNAADGAFVGDTGYYSPQVALLDKKLAPATMVTARYVVVNTSGIARDVFIVLEAGNLERIEPVD